MARWGVAATTLFAAVALGLSGCGVAQVAGPAGPAGEQAVEVAAALGVEGQALAALGLDPVEMDLVPVAASESPAPDAEAGRKERAEQWRKRRPARVLLRKNSMHGEVVVQTKEDGPRTVAVQRGEVTAIDDQQMTVRSSDGFELTWTFAPELRVVERRQTVQPEAIEVGRVLGVAGAKDGESGEARLIVLPKSE